MFGFAHSVVRFRRRGLGLCSGPLPSFSQVQVGRQPVVLDMAYLLLVRALSGLQAKFFHSLLNNVHFQLDLVYSIRLFLSTTRFHCAPHISQGFGLVPANYAGWLNQLRGEGCKCSFRQGPGCYCPDVLEAKVGGCHSPLLYPSRWARLYPFRRVKLFIRSLVRSRSVSACLRFLGPLLRRIVEYLFASIAGIYTHAPLLIGL